MFRQLYSCLHQWHSTKLALHILVTGSEKWRELIQEVTAKTCIGMEVNTYTVYAV